MYNMIEKYMNNITRDQVNDFALKKHVYLDDDELSFTYDFVKKNWKSIIGNPSLLNLDRYSNIYKKDNLNKIKNVFNEYYQKYQRFL